MQRECQRLGLSTVITTEKDSENGDFSQLTPLQVLVVKMAFEFEDTEGVRSLVFDDFGSEMPKQLNPDTITRLLVRGTNWVGDAVMSLPALKLLRQVFSSAHISLLVLPWVSGIYEGQELYRRSPAL